MYINIILFCLKVFVANEILQKEKGNLEKELQIFKEKYHKVSTELQSAMETLAKLENEKQARASFSVYTVFRSSTEKR